MHTRNFLKNLHFALNFTSFDSVIFSFFNSYFWKVRLYPIQDTLLHLRDEFCNYPIMIGTTVGAYLNAFFDVFEEQSWKHLKTCVV